MVFRADLGVADLINQAGIVCEDSPGLDCFELQTLTPDDAICNETNTKIVKKF
jgi:hypothetical protein